ncbi:MAG: PTS sugar transporter subunit IIA, partial [Planctomycetota bacterium]
MNTTDFDLAELATYLHLTPQQVERLVNRGKLPGRRVGGQWRFPRAEIHHWMEERMGVMDDEELAQLEDSLARNSSAHSLASLLQPETIAVPLVARTRDSAIRAMVELLANQGLVWDPDKMGQAIRQREELQSTALDCGVALLHPRRPQTAILGDSCVAMGVTGGGIPFGGSKHLTDIFFLIASMDDKTHLRSLARISRLLT